MHAGRLRRPRAIFVETKRGADYLENHSAPGFGDFDHGDRSQREREDALRSFVWTHTDPGRHGCRRACLDISGVTQVINFTCPTTSMTMCIASYTRAASAERKALSLFTDKNRGMARRAVRASGRERAGSAIVDGRNAFWPWRRRRAAAARALGA